MVVDLLARGADPNRGVCDDSTALGFATAFSNLPMMRLLLAHGANVNPPACDPPLTTASDPAAINLLLDHGADVNGRLVESSHAGDTALMVMVKQNQPELVRLLVARRADVNVLSTRDGHTALILAVIVRDAATVRFLLHHGAHINTVNRFGGTALQAAMQTGNHDIVKLLLAHAAKVSGRN